MLHGPNEAMIFPAMTQTIPDDRAVPVKDGVAVQTPEPAALAEGISGARQAAALRAVNHRLLAEVRKLQRERTHIKRRENPK